MRRFIDWFVQPFFIVRLFSCIFKYLQKINPIFLINTILQHMLKAYYGNMMYIWTDVWVLVWFFLGMLSWIFSEGGNIKRWDWVLIICGVLEVINIVVYHINVVFFDEYRATTKYKSYHVGSYRRMVICLLVNYIELIFWFAMFYRVFEFCFRSDGAIYPWSLCGSLYFSVVTMTTLGYGDITPLNSLGILICVTQTLIGIFMAVVVLTSFIRLLPIPRSKDWRE